MDALALRTGKIRRLPQDVLGMGGLVDPYSPHRRPLCALTPKGLFFADQLGCACLRS